MRVYRAFVEAMGELGNNYHIQYEHGNREVIQALSAEEANLLHARRLARQHGWWQCIISAMQGLRQLYDHTGRRAEWAQLVQAIVPDFVDLATDGPLPGREEQWSLVTEYRVRLAREAREWAAAERLQRVCVAWDRQQAAEAVGKLQGLGLQRMNDPRPSAEIPCKPNPCSSPAERNRIRTLGVSEDELGHILREQGKPECVECYKEAIQLKECIDNKTGAAITAFNLGHAYMVLPALRDLAQAEAWYRRSLELHAEGDRMGRAQSLGQLGFVAYERFKETRAADRPEAELRRHLNDAVSFYQQDLTLLPPNAMNDLATVHNALGVIYNDAGDLDRALYHYRECIRYDEIVGNLYGAAQTRGNVAIALKQAGRLEDALLYAQAALRNYATYGDRAAAEIQRTQGLIAEIEQAMK